MKIDRTKQLTWPELVERARTYLAANADPDNPEEWARHFAAGILAMDRGARAALAAVPPPNV